MKEKARRVWGTLTRGREMAKVDHAPMSEAERARRLHQCYTILLELGKTKGIIGQTADAGNVSEATPTPAATDARSDETEAQLGG